MKALSIHLTKELFIFAVLLLGLSAAVQWWTAMDPTGDKHLLLYITRQWFEGKRLYVDLFEVTPPLFWGLYTVPVTLAEWLGTQEGYTLNALALMLCGVSVLVIRNFMRFYPSANPSLLKAHILLLGLIFIAWPNTDHFGDREHVFLVLVFPYLLRWMPSLRHAPLPLHLKVTIAVLAMVGLNIKPFCMLLLFTAQLLIVMSERSLKYLFSLENCIIYAFSLMYLVVIALYTPEYFTVILPIAFATYAENSTGIVAPTYFALSFLYLAMTLADFRLRDTSVYRRDILYFLALCGGFCVYILLGSAWDYMFYPLNGMILYLTGWVWLEFRTLAHEHAQQKGVVKRFIFGARACAANIALHIAIILTSYGLNWTNALESSHQSAAVRCNDDIIALINTKQFQSFGAVAPMSLPWHTISRVTGAKQATRFSLLWMLPKLITADEEFKRTHEWILQYVAIAYAEDITRNKPDIVIVDASPAFYRVGRPVDMIALFSHYPDFTAAWAHYALLQTIDHCHNGAKSTCRYDVYKHISP